MSALLLLAIGVCVSAVVGLLWLCVRYLGAIINHLDRERTR